MTRKYIRGNKMTIKWALRRPRSLAVIATAAVITSVVVAAPAGGVGAGTNYPNIVNAVPFANTPNMTDGTVFAINQVGNMIFAGGSFTNVQNHGSTTNLPRAHIVGFDASTGAVSTTFNPNLDGSVEGIAPGPIANTVYVAGAFSTVNGVKSKGITLLSTTTGAIVSGFKPPALNGIVYAIALAAGRLYLAGSFTSANLIAHGGLAALNPTTGALDPFMNLQTSGHHNYNGSGANGAVGPRAMAVNPAGTRAVVIGNFKNVDGQLHDQVVMIDLDGASAAIDPNWNTQQFTARCSSGAFDTYVTDVQYSADGSYFAITATGGATTNNTDGTPSLCDSASRWESSTTGTNVKPTWVDFTGRDTLWSVAIAGNAIYVGGHERWLNNSKGADNAGPGGVPRPGMGALDPLSGVPLAWNPGRNPRGAGAYAMFVGTNGLYVGSDTDYIGNNKYKHQKLAYFPLAGGLAPAPTTTASLPANVYQVSPGTTGTSNVLQYRSYDGGTTVGPTTSVASSINWSATRGAFMVGNSIFYGTSDNQSFFRASYTGSTVGTPVLLDPYNDPAWANVQTGSGQTYVGKKSDYYGEMSGITGAFYSNGKLFYSRSGLSGLYWRWFSPDSGIIGSQEFSATSVGLSFANVMGMVLSGTTLYYANRTTGDLQSIPFNWSTGTVSGVPALADSTQDWQARSLFLNGSGAANQAPVAAATVTCNGLTCSFDGSTSHDPDGSVTSYAWDFGDGAAWQRPDHDAHLCRSRHVQRHVDRDRQQLGSVGALDGHCSYIVNDGRSWFRGRVELQRLDGEPDRRCPRCRQPW